jgi:outer membrane protein TolC
MAEAERLRVIDAVRKEVAEAQADVVGRRQVIEVAARQLRAAENGFRLDLTRSKNLEGRPIEVLNSANLLLAARQDLIRAMVGYNQAQFRLYVALGQPPSLPTKPKE